jgi:predicted dehydrogenase
MTNNSIVRLGIAGIGFMGGMYAKGIQAGAVNGLELCAVCDMSAQRRDWAKAELPGIPVFDNFEKMFDQRIIDAVLIAVPHFDHPSTAIKAFDAGLHVLCEKPAGVYTKQVKAMNQAADKTNLVFALMFQHRTNPFYRAMRDIFQTGALGELRRVNIIATDYYRPQSYFDAGGWRGTWAGEGGGLLLNQCPHTLDIWQWICGMPKRITAFCREGQWHDIETEDDVTAFAEYENGATAVFTSSTGDAPGTSRMELTGTLGKLVYENDKLTHYRLDQDISYFNTHAPHPFATPAFAATEVKTEGEYSKQMGVMQSFADAILKGTPLVADGREGINSLELSNAMTLSSWLGKSVELPLDDELYCELLSKKIGRVL